MHLIEGACVFYGKTCQLHGLNLKPVLFYHADDCPHVLCFYGVGLNHGECHFTYHHICY